MRISFLENWFDIQKEGEMRSVFREVGKFLDFFWSATTALWPLANSVGRRPHDGALSNFEKTQFSIEFVMNRREKHEKVGMKREKKRK